MRLSCLASLFVCLAVSGCSGNKDAAPPRTDGKISIKGSNTVGEELGPQLIAEYKKEHPGAEFDLESKATGYGLAALLAGQCDIAAASRTPIKDELSLAQSRGVELNDYVIGSYSVAVVVNSNNPVADLTVAQVRDLFTGTIKNWKELGGPDAPVQLYVRDPISGTYLGFRELALDNKPYGAGLKTFTNYSGIVHQFLRTQTGSVTAASNSPPRESNPFPFKVLPRLSPQSTKGNILTPAHFAFTQPNQANRLAPASLYSSLNPPGAKKFWPKPATSPANSPRVLTQFKSGD